jgi:hypothetical protein
VVPSDTTQGCFRLYNIHGNKIIKKIQITCFISYRNYVQLVGNGNG